MAMPWHGGGGQPRKNFIVVEPRGGTGVVLKVQVTGSDSNLHACQSKPVVIYNSLFPVQSE